MDSYRTEHDLLGERPVPSGVLHGIHTERAVENFPLTGRPVNPALIHARGEGKGIRAIVLEEGLLTAGEFERLVSPESVTRFGSPPQEQP